MDSIGREREKIEEVLEWGMMGRFWREKSLVQEKSLKASDKKIIMHRKKKIIMHRKNAHFS